MVARYEAMAAAHSHRQDVQSLPPAVPAPVPPPPLAPSRYEFNSAGSRSRSRSRSRSPPPRFPARWPRQPSLPLTRQAVPPTPYPPLYHYQQHSAPAPAPPPPVTSISPASVPGTSNDNPSPQELQPSLPLTRQAVPAAPYPPLYHYQQHSAPAPAPPPPVTSIPPASVPGTSNDNPSPQEQMSAPKRKDPPKVESNALNPKRGQKAGPEDKKMRAA